MGDKQNTEKKQEKDLNWATIKILLILTYEATFPLVRLGALAQKKSFTQWDAFFPSNIILQMDTHVCPCVMRFISVLKNEKNALYSSLKELTEATKFENLF